MFTPGNQLQWRECGDRGRREAVAAGGGWAAAYSTASQLWSIGAAVPRFRLHPNLHPTYHASCEAAAAGFVGAVCPLVLRAAGTGATQLAAAGV